MSSQPKLVFDSPPKITSSLKEKAILVDFDGGFFNWQKRDRRIEAAVAKANDVSRNAVRTLKNLFLGCDSQLAAIRSIVQQARCDSDAMTLPWSPGRRLLLNVAVLPYKERQMRYRTSLDEAKDALSSVYPNLLTTAKHTLGPLFNGDDYPSLSSILASAYITHRFYPLADASDVRLSCDSALVADIRAEVEAEAANTYRSAVLSTWERLLDIMKSATSNLSKGLDGPTSQRYRSEWHDHLSSLVPLLSSLNLDEDPRLDAMAHRCSAILRSDPQEYEVSLDARARAYTKAQSIYDDLSSIFGQMKQE